jgi:hypothetical protein
MSTSEYLSKSEFAVLIGRAPSYVSWLNKNARLVLSPNGKRVDVTASLELIKNTADPSKSAVVDRHAEDRQSRFGAQASNGILESLSTSAFGEGSTFQQSKAHRERFEGLISETKYRRLQAELVGRVAVENAAFATARMLRDLLLALPKQISPELAALTDPWELERLLTTGLRRVLEDAERVSATDLADAINSSN